MIPPVSAMHSELSAPQLAKLKKGAQDFEAMMVAQMWKGAKDDDEEDQAGSTKTMSDIGSQALAQGVAARGGFGFAKMVLKQLAPGQH